MIIRILSYNIHKGVGWVNGFSTLNQIHTEICDLHPDVIFLQEVRGSQFELLTSKIWLHHQYGKNAVTSKGHHGNVILSKFPILFSDNIDLSMNKYERRGLLYAMIEPLKEQQPIHLLCVHLGLLKNDRRKQLDKIVEYIQSNIPEDEPLILGGDFNDWTRYATKPLIHHLKLHEAFLQKHGAYARTFPAWSPVLKLDRIYFRKFDIIQAHRMIKKPWKMLSDHIALEVHLQTNRENNARDYLNR